MTQTTGLITPPAHPLHRKPLPRWRLLAATLSNPLTTLTEESFTHRSGRVRMFGPVDHRREPSGRRQACADDPRIQIRPAGPGRAVGTLDDGATGSS
jgi:hypothetical protein